MTTAKTTIPHQDGSTMIEHIQRIYQRIDAKTLEQGILADLYTVDAEFIDPFHHLKGLATLDDYFKKLYKNVRSIEFEYGHCAQNGNQVFMEWVMTVEHPRLRGGAPVKLNGVTRFVLEGNKVRIHRDYFDAGQMLYENLPVLGSIIRKIKDRMAK